MHSILSIFVLSHINSFRCPRRPGKRSTVTVKKWRRFCVTSLISPVHHIFTGKLRCSLFSSKISSEVSPERVARLWKALGIDRLGRETVLVNYEWGGTVRPWRVSLTSETETKNKVFKIITETNGFSTRGRCTVGRAGLYDSFSVGPNGRFRDSLRGTRPAVLFSHVSLHVPRSEVSACTRHLPPTYTPDGLGPAATYGCRIRGTSKSDDRHAVPLLPGEVGRENKFKDISKTFRPPGRRHAKTLTVVFLFWRRLTTALTKVLHRPPPLPHRVSLPFSCTVQWNI